MRQPYQEPRIGNRRWIAWKLVQLAWRVYNPEYCQRIHITRPDGRQVFEAVIVADLYGNGVSSTIGVNPWDNEMSIPAGSTLIYEDEYEPDWLTDESDD
ncbi:hypothetical protein [Mycobacterium phage WXIN]|nr:hypothetical protein [Mycobacterium phage WXIN]